MIVINTSTRQFNIPGADMTFGVEADAASERKYFQCPRYVGNNLDLMGCFVRLNYRNANGEVDSYLVEDMTVDGDNVLFSWELSPKVTAYKGQIRFVLCVVGPDTKVAWHTTLGTGVVLEGLEPDREMIQAGTADVVATLITMVGQQTGAVEAEGANQIKAVQTAAQAAQSDAVAEIEAKGVNVRASIPDDYTALSGAVRAIEKGMAPGIVCEVEGTAVAVSDASNQAMQGIKIFGRSTQNGVPTPDAPVEIKSVEKPVVTVCGKNLLVYPYKHTTITANGLSFTDNGDGSISVSGTATTTTFFQLADLPRMNGNLVVGGCPAGGAYATYQLTVDKNGAWYVNDYGNGASIECDGADTYSLAITIRKDATVSNLTFRPYAHVGEYTTEYEPYKPVQTVELTHTLPGIPVTSGGNYTDSDGQQWISDEVDLERGVYVQRVGVRVFTGTTETWKDGTISASGQHYVYLADATVTVLNGSVCSHGVSNYSGSWNTGSYWRSGTGLFQVFSDMSLSEWKDYLIAQNTAGTPVTLQFRMDAPIETPLSETEIAAYRALHTNKPNTTVLNDAGAHMVVKYAADTKLYIDNKIKEVLG